MQPKLIIAFKYLGEADFLAQAEGIVTALTGNADFPEPWPAPLAGSAQLAADVAAYQSACNAAKGGDKQKIAMRAATRAVVTADLKQLALYLEMVANGNLAALLTTGYELRHSTAKKSSANLDVLAAPEDFRVARALLSGEIVVHARKLHGAGAYDVQTTLADPTVETNWADAGTYTRCSKIELNGFTPGTRVSVRMRGIGSHSPGAWTTAASLMVV